MRTYKIWARSPTKCYGPLVAWRTYAVRWDHPAPPIKPSRSWFDPYRRRYVHDVRTMADKHYRVDKRHSKFGGMAEAPWFLNLDAVMNWAGEYLSRSER